MPGMWVLVYLAFIKLSSRRPYKLQHTLTRMTKIRLCTGEYAAIVSSRPPS